MTITTTPAGFHAAFYKSTRPGIKGIYNRLVRWWTRSPYSHSEFIFSDGQWGTSSLEDGGVRLKAIEFNSDNWDVVALSPHLEAQCRAFIEANLGKKYDIVGNLGFIFGPIRNHADKFFCSEVMAAALDTPNPESFHPGLLHALLKNHK